MAIEFRCPTCSALLRTPDETAGKKAKCPQCGTIADIPASSEPSGDTAARPLAESLPAAQGADNPFGDRSGQGPTPQSPFEAANPYAPPPLHDSTGGDEVPAHGPLQATRIQFEDLFRRTWQFFSPNFGPCALVGLVMLGFLLGFQAVSMGMGFAAQASGEPALVVTFQVLNQLLSVLLQTWLNMGIAYVGLRLVRTGQVQVSDFFAIGPYYLRGLGMTLLIALIAFGAVAICLLPALGVLLAQGGPAGVQAEPIPIIVAASLGVLAAVVAVTWVMLRAYLGYPFILEQNLGVVEALRQSDLYMRGNKLLMFAVLLIVGMASGLFTCATCYVGIIFVYPYGGVLTAVAYLTATGQFRAEPQGMPPSAR
jgi:phage FluMu protein Com